VTGVELGAMLGLGAFHGLNPGMGWLFAVALGLQQGDRGAVLRALPPIALGHAAAVLVALALFESLRAVASPRAVGLVTGGILIGFGLWHLVRRRHPGRVGMRLRPRELAAWSFVMASAHGAGLMLLPIASRVSIDHPVTGVVAATVVEPSSAAVVAAAVHTAGMLAMMAGIALLVYDHLGVAVLRRAWINTDVLWWLALITAGVIVLFS
jgi:hypothetical protein